MSRLLMVALHAIELFYTDVKATLMTYSNSVPYALNHNEKTALQLAA